MDFPALHTLRPGIPRKVPWTPTRVQTNMQSASSYASILSSGPLEPVSTGNSNNIVSALDGVPQSAIDNFIYIIKALANYSVSPDLFKKVFEEVRKSPDLPIS